VVAGRGPAPLLVGAVVLMVVLAAIAVPVTGLTSPILALDVLGGVLPSGTAGSIPAYMARLIGAAPATAAGILLVATIAVGALARRRAAS
jgi:hypothetical protein